MPSTIGSPDEPSILYSSAMHSRRGCSNPTRFREGLPLCVGRFKPGVEPPLAMRKANRESSAGHWVGLVESLLVFHGMILGTAAAGSLGAISSDNAVAAYCGVLVHSQLAHPCRFRFA